MAGNVRMLEFWIEAFCAELQELLAAPVTARATEDAPQAASAYRSMLLVEGPVHGVMYITTSSASMVQFAQMAAGELVDSHAAWTGEGLEAWRRLLDATGTRFATRLTEQVSGSSQGRCTILLAETTAVDGMHLVSESGTAASGATVQQWLLQTGQGEIALSASVQVEFPGEESQVPATQTEQSAGNAQAQDQDQDQDSGETYVDEGSSEAAAPPAFAAFAVENDAAKDSPEQTDERRTQTAGAAAATRKEDASQADKRATQPQDRPNGREPRPRLDLLLDIELEATLRFGALELPLREVLELGPGDVLPLDRHVREPVDLVVGDRIVARGEVVLVGGNFALHVTEVAEPRSRLETIRCLF